MIAVGARLRPWNPLEQIRPEQIAEMFPRDSGDDVVERAAKPLGQNEADLRRGRLAAGRGLRCAWSYVQPLDSRPHVELRALLGQPLARAEPDLAQRFTRQEHLAGFARCEEAVDKDFPGSHDGDVFERVARGISSTRTQNKRTHCGGCFCDRSQSAIVGAPASGIRHRASRSIARPIASRWRPER